MPRLRDRAVLDAGLTGPQLLWEQEGFALADGYDTATAKYRALVLPTDGINVAITDTTLIVRQSERRPSERPRQPTPRRRPLQTAPLPDRDPPHQGEPRGQARPATSAASASNPTDTHRTSRSSPTRSSDPSARPLG